MKLAECEATVAKTDTAFGASETLDHLLRVAAHIRASLGDFLEQYSLTEVRYSILATLRAAALTGLSQAELAERLMQSESNISTLIERMQQEGFVDRLRSDADRRKWVLLLSPSGQRLFDRVEIAKRSWAARLTRGVPVDDRSTLGLLVRQLSENLDGNTTTKLSPPVLIPDEVAYSREEHPWAERHSDSGGEPRSPHLALRQMLSALSLNRQLAEDEV